MIDPFSSWLITQTANRAINALLAETSRKKIAGELRKWASENGELVPETMSTLFDGSGDGPCSQQRREQLAKHELPDAASWTAAAFERGEEIHASGEDVQSFFRLEPEEARPFLEDLGQRLATIVAGEPELFGPAVVSRLDSLGTAEARKYLREISAEFIEEKRQADIGEVLGAAIGDWPMVAQDRDFRRQLEPELLARLDEATQPGLLVILRHPGAGET